MEKMARVPLKNGNWKYFYGDNAEKEANAYEVELKQREIEEKERQKKEQEERAKAIAKAEAERKAKDAQRIGEYENIQLSLGFMNDLITNYEKKHGEMLTKSIIDGKLIVSSSPFARWNDDNIQDLYLLFLQ